MPASNQYNRKHWVRSAAQKRDALGPRLAADAERLADQLLANDAIGYNSHGRRIVQGMRVTIEATFQGRDIIQVEDVYLNRD